MLECVPRRAALMTASSWGRDGLHVPGRIVRPRTRVPVEAPTARAAGVPKASGRRRNRLRQRCEQIAPLALDAVPVLRDEAREEGGEAAKAGRGVAGGGERNPEEDVRILLCDARVAALDERHTARREPAVHAEHDAHTDERQERPDERVDRNPGAERRELVRAERGHAGERERAEPAEAQRKRRRAGLRRRADDLAGNGRTDDQRTRGAERAYSEITRKGVSAFARAISSRL